MMTVAVYFCISVWTNALDQLWKVYILFPEPLQEYISLVSVQLTGERYTVLDHFRAWILAGKPSDPFQPLWPEEGGQVTWLGQASLEMNRTNVAGRIVRFVWTLLALPEQKRVCLGTCMLQYGCYSGTVTEKHSDRTYRLWAEQVRVATRNLCRLGKQTDNPYHRASH
jgi:hypothetical protein